MTKSDEAIQIFYIKNYKRISREIKKDLNK